MESENNNNQDKPASNDNMFKENDDELALSMAFFNSLVGLGENDNDVDMNKESNNNCFEQIIGTILNSMTDTEINDITNNIKNKKEDLMKSVVSITLKRNKSTNDMIFKIFMKILEKNHTE
jgi:hypothetical protein